MGKRGQLTVFIILGITLLLLTAIFLYYRNIDIKKAEPSAEKGVVGYLTPEEFKAHVVSCIEQTSEPWIKFIGEQGGTLNLDSYKEYFNFKYRYLCHNQQEYGCVNDVLTRREMENQLNKVIKDGMLKCINFDEFKKQGYEIKTGTLDVKTSIAASDINILVTYPIEIKKADFVLNLNEFSAKLEIPLGKMYDLAMQILNSEIEKGYFNKDEWMIQHGGEIKIDKHKPYPDTVYSLEHFSQKTQKKYRFNFALQGRDTVSLIGMPEQTKIPSFYGYCRTDNDKNCYANSQKDKCIEKKGTYSLEKPASCSEISTYSDELCNGRECKDCGSKKHGDRWCEYDGIVGQGFDLVGSRHYLHSCIDGAELVEECRDYREELCAENNTITPTDAVCRVNRWQDCSKQTSEQECMDSSKRDCFWSDYLVNKNGIKSYGMKRLNQTCHPYVPPGFRHWQSENVEVCNMANEWRYCDSPIKKPCPKIWTDATALYCDFQGDCGNSRNYVGELTKYGYYSSDDKPRDYIYLDENAIKNYYTINLITDAYEPVEIKGDEFSNPKGTPAAIKKEGKKFKKEASKWGPCTFCERCAGIGPCFCNCVFDKETFAFEVCYPWQAPIDSKECSLCTADPLRVCSEYKCKSLGRYCIYSEEKGIPSCASPAVGTEKPKIIGLVNNSLPAGYSAEKDFFLAYEGYRIKPELEPYTMFSFGFETNEETQCKTSPFPGMNYDDISPLFDEYLDYSFKKEHIIDMKVTSSKQIRQRMANILGISTILPLSSLTYIDNYVSALKEKTLKKAKKYGINTQGMEESFNLFMQDYNWDIRPVIQQYLEATGNLLQTILINMNQDNFYVFIKCIDRNNNELEKDFFIRYSIGNDTKTAKLVSFSPENNSIVSDPFNLELYLDEPAECKYSVNSDSAYDSMRNKMNCSVSEFDADENENYLCHDNLDMGNNNEINLYIKCRDQPMIDRKYYLNLAKSKKFEITEPIITWDMIEANLPLINVSDSFILQDNNETFVGINISTFNISMRFNEKSKCRYSETTADKMYDELTNDMECNSTVCRKELSFEKNTNLYFDCIDADYKPGNINEDSFVLVYHKS